jgi:type IV secretory pathway component VirB8
LDTFEKASFASADSTQIECAMRVFGIALLIAVVLTIGFAIVLNSTQKTVQEEFSTEAARP